MNRHVKQFIKVELSSTNALQQFEGTVVKLRSDNEELAKIHASVEEEIEALTNLKDNIVQRISNNNNAIDGLERLLKGE